MLKPMFISPNYYLMVLCMMALMSACRSMHAQTSLDDAHASGGLDSTLGPTGTPIENGPIPAFEYFPSRSIVGDTIYYLGPHADQQFYIFNASKTHPSYRNLILPRINPSEMDSFSREMYPYLISTGYDRPILLHHSMQENNAVSIFRQAYFVPPAQTDTSGELTIDFKHYLLIDGELVLDLPRNVLPHSDCTLIYSPYRLDDDHLLFPVRCGGSEHPSFKQALFKNGKGKRMHYMGFYDIPSALDSVETFLRDGYLCGQWRPVVAKLQLQTAIDLSTCLLDRGWIGHKFVAIDYIFTEDTCGVLYALFGQPPSVWYDRVDLRTQKRISHERITGTFDHRTLVMDGPRNILGLSIAHDSLLTWHIQLTR